MSARHQKGLFFIAIFLAVVVLVLPAVAAEEETAAENVAVVNGSPIAATDFSMEVNGARQQLLGMGRPINEAQMATLKEKVLEDLIDMELLYQESMNQGIEIDQAAIDEHMRVLRRRYERKLAIEQLIDKKFSVSEEETRAYYDSNPSLSTRPEEVRASHILIKVDPEADESQKAEARKKLEDVKQKLDEGQEFSALAREFSEGPSKVNGGDLGYFKRGQMVKSFEDAAFALEPGQLSDIVETQFGYHLIKTVDKKPETVVPFEEMKDRIERLVQRDKVQKGMRPFIAELKEKAQIELIPMKEE